MKYSQYSRDTGPKTRQVHPIWRGVGFALMILTPVLAYAAATLLIEQNKIHRWVAIPPELLIKQWPGDPLIAVKAILTLVLIVLIGAFFTMVTFVLYSAFGPPRYGPFDVPPVTYRGKRYRR